MSACAGRAGGAEAARQELGARATNRCAQGARAVSTALLHAPVAHHPVLYLAPYLTPALWLGAIAWLGRSRAYAGAAALFVLAHGAHGVLALRAL